MKRLPKDGPESGIVQRQKKSDRLILLASHLRLCIPCLLLFFLLTAATPPVPASARDSAVRIREHLSLGVKTKRFFSSHTSFEFGNPFPPFQAPLSRLEFPLDSWWAGAELRATFPRFSLGVEGLTNVSHATRGLMRDSDWDNDANPDLKTIYSESKSRMEPSYTIRTDIDLKVSDWLALPGWLDLRPIAGFRWQDFNLVTHDGIQFDLMDGGPVMRLPGDGIRFEQTYRQYFLGMRAGLDLGKHVMMNRLTAFLQLDWAYVGGRNEDYHLLRIGERYTYEDTRGHAWHGSVGLKAGLSRHVALILDADFLRISTTGSHRFVNAPLDMYLEWSNGVKVWSEQNSISLMLEYAF